jgi:hypothetical protein
LAPGPAGQVIDYRGFESRRTATRVMLHFPCLVSYDLFAIRSIYFSVLPPQLSYTDPLSVSDQALSACHVSARPVTLLKNEVLLMEIWLILRLQRSASSLFVQEYLAMRGTPYVCPRHLFWQLPSRCFHGSFGSWQEREYGSVQPHSQFTSERALF